MTQTKDGTPPIASALVIGIGGSGVHTLARLRAAVRDDSRPGVVAVDNVKFLAIDAVEQNAQLPALPPNAGLATEEFYNVAADPINAFEYVRQAWQHDESLRMTWDLNYRAPNQTLTDGMKRSRPLGNLVFRVQQNKVQSALQRALGSVVDLNPDLYARGNDAGASRVAVFIAASSAGGTGSSGFLHVLHALHRAAKSIGVTLAVYPVLFLPDVFVSARRNSLDAAMEQRAHWSNAYAFFSELEYVISEPRAFDELLCPSDHDPTGVQAIDVVENVFLIDGRLTDGSQISQEDAYDLAAAGLHSLLLAEPRSLLGVAGTNVAIKGYDALEPPQRTAYASMGAFRTVFPGSTYRRYAQARLRAYLLERYLIDEAATTNQVERGQRIISQLVDGLWGLRGHFDTKARSLRPVRDLLTRANAAQEELSEGDVAATVVEHSQVLGHDADQAAAVLADVLPAQASAAIAAIPSLIDDVLRSSGEGVDVLKYAVEKARLALDERARTAEVTRKSAQDAATNLQAPDRDDSLSDHARKVQQATMHMFLLRRGELKEAIKGYSDAATMFADKLVRSHIAQAEVTVAKAAAQQLEVVADALTAARLVLRGQRDDYTRLWEDDELEGKDVGSAALMAVVPGDVLGQVEDSAVAKALWARIEQRLRENQDFVRGESDAAGVAPKHGLPWLRSLYELWWKRGSADGVRGLVSLGQGESNAVAQSRSGEILDRVLTAQVRELCALKEIMPPDLEAATKLADAVAAGDILAEDVESRSAGAETRRMWIALEETLKKSSLVALQIDRARIKLQSDAAAPPPVVHVMATGRMLDYVQAQVPGAKPVDSEDPEQVCTLAIQRGFPISSVVGIDLWRRAHRNVERDRARFAEKSNDPPPFLDNLFSKAVSKKPLLRRLYTDDAIAEMVVSATVLSRMTDTEPVTAANLRLLKPLIAEYVSEDGADRTTRKIFRPLDIQDGVVRYNGDPVPAGTTASQVFDCLATEVLVQKGIASVYDLLLNRARELAGNGDSTLREAMSRVLNTYREENQRMAALLPTVNPTDVTRREKEVRRALDTAAARAISEVNEPLRPPPQDGV